MLIRAFTELDRAGNQSYPARDNLGSALHLVDCRTREVRLPVRVEGAGLANSSSLLHSPLAAIHFC